VRLFTAMLGSSFQLGPGLGYRSEQLLWQAGIVRWEDYGSSSVALSRPADARLRAAIPRARAAFAAADAEALAELLPAAEHWRLYAAFAAGAAYLDIETSDDAVGACAISAVGILDRSGPRILLAGRDLERFPELARNWSVLVTFNGSCFDVPILRRAFPDWQPPRGHIDLRHVLRRLGHTGGLKTIERRLPLLHLARPAHLDGLDGGNAGWLFVRGRGGDRAALRRFAEYNLYDVINLRTLMAHAYNALVEAQVRRAPALAAWAPRVAVPGRGDVLYDVSKILLGL
jgi:uncharacterized protein YprB with RNaseH-like and TPR domain